MSSMAIETRIHSLHTYKVYPRAHYFRKRLLNLYPRFRRVIDKFPDSLQDPARLQRIEQYAHIFANPAEIVFLGNGALDVGAMVVDGAQLDTDDHWDHDDGYPTPTIPVCYITVEDDDEIGRKIADHVLKAFFKSETYKKRVSSRLFIRVDILRNLKQSQLESYIKFIENTIRMHASPCARQYRLSINKHDKDEHAFGKNISDCLEIEMKIAFEKIRYYLRRFVGTANTINIESRIIDEVNTTLRAFVVDEYALGDALQVAANEGSADTSKHVRQPADVFIECISIRLKCLMIPLLSRKYGLAESLTTALSEKMQFTHQIPADVMHNTRLCLAQMYDLDLKPKMLNRQETTDKLMSSLTKDLSPVITEAEAAAGTARTIVTTVSKMIYEVGGYVDMSTTGTTSSKDDAQAKVPVLTAELRRSIARIPGVYGHGVLYGKLEVHVTRSDTKVNDAIAAALLEHNFHLEYNVQLVKSQPETFAGGMSIRRQPFDGEYGTLGGYVTDRDTEEVYAITCAHVVNTLGAGDQEVFIKEREQYRRLGFSTQRLCLYNVPPLVDFAAVKVNSDLIDQSVLLWEDESGVSQRGQLAESQSGNDAMQFKSVYKYGATSNLTYGTVVDSNYRVGANSSIIMIQTLPGDDQRFAMSGDSGAVVCAPNVDTVGMVHIVSMVVGGDVKMVGVAEDTVVTSPLSKCLHELRNKSDIDLGLP